MRKQSEIVNPAEPITTNVMAAGLDAEALGRALLRLSGGEQHFAIPGTHNNGRIFDEGLAVFDPNGRLLSFTPNRTLWVCPGKSLTTPGMSKVSV